MNIICRNTRTFINTVFQYIKIQIIYKCRNVFKYCLTLTIAYTTSFLSGLDVIQLEGIIFHAYKILINVLYFLSLCNGRGDPLE